MDIVVFKLTITLKLYFFILFIVIKTIGFAQEHANQLEFVLENDKFLLQDKYYTSGLFISYKRALKSDFIFKKKETNRLQFEAKIGNETYTPTDLSSFDASTFDRPFAGWLFLKMGLTNVYKKSLLAFAVETGVTGEQALSGSFQMWFHNFIGLDDVISWEQEIENKFLVNLKTQYTHHWVINASQAFQYSSNTSIGTKDIFLQNGVSYYVGAFQSFQQSSITQTIANTTANELYAFVKLSHRYVFHNTLVQGSLDFMDATFTSKVTSNVFNLKIGGVLKQKRNIYKVVYNFNTKETPKSSSHAYGSLVYSYSF